LIAQSLTAADFAYDKQTVCITCCIFHIWRVSLREKALMRLHDEPENCLGAHEKFDPSVESSNSDTARSNFPVTCPVQPVMTFDPFMATVQ
jgi:hypothetical protein